MVRNRRFMIVTIVLSCLLLFGAIAAQVPSPAVAAMSVRDALFDAQASLIRGDSAGAELALHEAQASFTASLAPTFRQFAPDSAATIEAALVAANTSVSNGDGVALAAARGEVYAALMSGGTQVVFAALADGDGDLAARWLLLRDFRPSTRFSRPDADATLAVQAVVDGTGTTDAALNAVRADLFDTYQALLNTALANADEAGQNGFRIRQAEEAGLAVGYFNLLAVSYGEQRGADALTTAKTAFADLQNAVITDDHAAYELARANVNTVLSGFRAAPLSDAEAARRAGQFTRFIALVPVEYARGVRNGEVVNDIEIQEALTFHEGASAAFADLRAILETQDPTGTDQIAALLATALDQIRNTADPAALQATVDTITAQMDVLTPAEWQTVNNDSDVDVIYTILDQVVAAAEQDEYALAESSRLEAYAMLEFGMEQRLRGFAPDKAQTIESLFWGGTDSQAGLATLIGSQATTAEVTAAVSVLKVALADAQTFLSSANYAPEVVIGNAGIIVFREGLEAVLILASLLASLRSGEERKFRRPIILGAGLAFGATAITWWFATQILLSMMHLGERLEAIVSVIAIGVLLVIMNWFFHKVYWTGWLANFHQKKQRLIRGARLAEVTQVAGLVILGFTSIYREGFESVLFLQSLLLEAGASTVMQGVALGLLGVALVGVLIFFLQVKLPYKKLLIVTGMMIGVVLLVMVGNTVHVLQAVGWLPITPVQGMYVPLWMGQWLGIFPTWQGLILQFVTMIYIFGSYYLAERSIHSKRDQSMKRQQISTAGP
ncbi:MAG: FTR1 family protein [Anaerolineaceae bacterium]|nr:FTR1 family protein [Anaerolineaceae bacterium]